MSRVRCLPIPCGGICRAPLTVNARRCHRYTVGQNVDVLDIYWGSRTGKLTKAWQPGRIKATTSTRVLVAYTRFKSYWDEWMDMSTDADRLAYVTRWRCCVSQAGSTAPALTTPAHPVRAPFVTWQ